MTNWYKFSSSDSKQPSHGLGNVLSQIVLGKSIKPDFNAEEKLSIEKDTREINHIVLEMADYLPKEDPDKGKERSGIPKPGTPCQGPRVQNCHLLSPISVTH